MKRASGVLKKKIHIRQTYVGDTSKRVMCEFGKFGVRPARVAIRRLKSVRVSCVLGLKMF